MIVCRSCNLTAFTHSLTGPVGQPFASRHKGSGFNPQGVLETRILLLALSRYIGDPDVIDHCSLVWGGFCPKPSLGNVIIPLNLPQLFCPGFKLTAGPPSGFTTDIVGECLQSHCIHTQSHRFTGPLLPVMRDPGSILKWALMWNQDSPVSIGGHS